MRNQQSSFFCCDVAYLIPTNAVLPIMKIQLKNCANSTLPINLDDKFGPVHNAQVGLAQKWGRPSSVIKVKYMALILIAARTITISMGRAG